MLNNITQRTLIASLKEFWAFNGRYLFILPLAIIVVHLIFLLNPGSFLYQVLNNPPLINDNTFLINKMDHGYSSNRAAFLIIPFFFILYCTSRYLFRIKKYSRYTTMPIPDRDRVQTLWFYSFVFTFIGGLTLFLLDQSTVALFKHFLSAKTITAKEEIGILYPVKSDSSHFTALEPFQYLAPFIYLLILPLYHLAHFLFKKYSLLLTSLLGILVITISALIYFKLNNHHLAVNILPETLFMKLLPTLIIMSVYGLAFRYILKEREV